MLAVAAAHRPVVGQTGVRRDERERYEMTRPRMDGWRASRRVRRVASAAMCLTVACRNPREAPTENSTPTASVVPTTTANGARAATPTGFEMKSITLYQPNEVMQERVPDMRALTSYIRSVQTACQSHFAGVSAPELLDVVVAIRPGRRARAWFVSTTRPVNDESLSRLRRQIETVPPAEVRGGPVAFAIVASIAGASQPSPDPSGYAPPMPREWREAPIADSGAVVPDDILRVVWPEP